MEEPLPYHTQETIKICIVNTRGDSVDFECASSLIVEKIKIAALTHFYRDQLDCLKSCNCYKMVSISKKKTLVDEASIRDEELSNGDIILLLERFPQNQPLDDVINTDTAPKRVTEAMIDEATKNLKPKNMNHKIPEHANSFEVREKNDVF